MTSPAWSVLWPGPREIVLLTLDSGKGWTELLGNSAEDLHRLHETVARTHCGRWIEDRDSHEKTFERACEIAAEMGHNYLGLEHLILSVLKEPTQELAPIFEQFGLSYDAAVTRVRQMLGGGTWLHCSASG